MLKIKDEVDLKELEKFGFKDESSFWFVKELFNSVDSVVIGVNKQTKGIQLAWHVKWEGKGWFTEFTYDIDILFDLITAGLVEKVVE